MVPAGYMAKRVVNRPDWLHPERVSSIFSVSGCISENFTNYIDYWMHNGYWLFDSPAAIIDIAREKRIDLSGTVLFFYEVHELEFDKGEWIPFEPQPSFTTNVNISKKKLLEGYDVVTFSVGTSPECSPLSCNGLATEVQTNSRCLLESLEQAQRLLENGTFQNSEPGPYRIFAVYSVAGWSRAAAVSRERNEDT
jgi:hypothetical protein